MNELPFETASSVADRLELSPMTVGRFLRALGYQGLDGIKVHLKENVAPLTMQLPNMLEQLQRDANEGRPLAGQIAEQVEMLQHIYNLAGQPQWQDAISAILSADEVFVAAHLSLAPVGRRLCERLEFARDHVQFLDGANGSYIEMLGHQPNDAVVVIIDSPRFVSSRLLARSARRAGYRVLLMTAQYTEWAHEFANVTLSLPPSRAGNRDNLAAMMALVEFLATATVQAAGEEGENRTRRIEELESLFAHSPLR